MSDIWMTDDEFRRKLLSELHDIALSLRAMSGRNVVKTGEPKRKENYADWYFGNHDDSR